MGKLLKSRSRSKQGPWGREGRSDGLARQIFSGLRILAIWVAIGLITFGVVYNLGTRSKPLEQSTTGTKSSSKSDLVGRASVIDGDTIEIHDQRIRLNGIDAPESDQICRGDNNERIRCGALSAAYLSEFLRASSPTRCKFVERDQYDRFVGDCYREDGKSVAAAMVSAGHALDWPKYSNGKYASFQQRARAEKRGLWATRFANPWDYRVEQGRSKQVSNQPRYSLAPDTASDGNRFNRSDCRIKGNISQNNGKKIYHVPGQRHYSQTRISPQHGERWFCSEAEAVAAGWRKSRS
jgi:endonuclease YncB( thermonuclease family)